MPSRFDEPCEHLALALAESFLAFELEDERNSDSGPPLQRLVGVDEVLAERGREPPADGALARAHRADQEDVGRNVHGTRRKRPSRLSTDPAQILALRPGNLTSAPQS